MKKYTVIDLIDLIKASDIKTLDELIGGLIHIEEKSDTEEKKEIDLVELDKKQDIPHVFSYSDYDEYADRELSK